MISIVEKQKKAFEKLKEKFGYKNVMQAPKVQKVVISVGTGKVVDKKRKEMIGERLMRISGQKPAVRGAKKSIASFKVRQGDEIGYQVTLRGSHMMNFLEKLINIALPRTKDFRGLKTSSVDEMGNYSFGIKEHNIFPETSDEDIKDVFSFGVTVVTSSKNKSETIEFLRLIGFPFVK